MCVVFVCVHVCAVSMCLFTYTYACVYYVYIHMCVFIYMHSICGDVRIDMYLHS